LAAESAAELRDDFGFSIRLITVLPCRGQEAYWNENDRSRFDRVMKKSDEVRVLSKTCGWMCMIRHDRYMAEQAGYCVMGLKEGGVWRVESRVSN